MLAAQVLALTLIPLLSGGLPAAGSPTIDVSVLLALESPVTDSYMVGTWKCTEHFMRWGVTDTRRPRIGRFGRHAFMRLNADGTFRMTNLFRPEEGRWEVSGNRFIMYHPDRSDRGSQTIQVKRRDDKRIWLLLPFASGATGIGMVRVPDEEMQRALRKPRSGRSLQAARRRTSHTVRQDDLDASAEELLSSDDGE